MPLSLNVAQAKNLRTILRNPESVLGRVIGEVPVTGHERGSGPPSRLRAQNPGFRMRPHPPTTCIHMLAATSQEQRSPERFVIRELSRRQAYDPISNVSKRLDSDGKWLTKRLQRLSR